MLFRVAVRNNHFPRMGERVELSEAAQEDWAYEIAKGFLVPVDDPQTVPAPAPLLDSTVTAAAEHVGVLPGDPDADLAENGADDAEG